MTARTRGSTTPSSRVAPRWPLDREAVLLVAAGGGVLAGTWVLATAEHTVPGWEARGFHAVNRLPDELWPAVWGPMQLGSLAGSLAVPAAVVAAGGDRRVALAAFAGSQAAWWAGKLVKRVVRRGRPAVLLDGVVDRERATGLGYVSGHAAVAAALATALAPSTPWRWRPVLFGTAAFVGAARIYAGCHLPLDVAGGSGLGVLTGTAARWLAGPRVRSPRRAPAAGAACRGRRPSGARAGRP